MTFDLKILEELDFVEIKKKVSMVEGGMFLSHFYKDNYIVAGFQIDNIDECKKVMNNILHEHNGVSLTNAFDESFEKSKQNYNQ